MGEGRATGRAPGDGRRDFPAGAREPGSQTKGVSQSQRWIQGLRGSSPFPTRLMKDTVSRRGHSSTTSTRLSWAPPAPAGPALPQGSRQHHSSGRTADGAVAGPAEGAVAGHDACGASPVGPSQGAMGVSCFGGG